MMSRHKLNDITTKNCVPRPLSLQGDFVLSNVTYEGMLLLDSNRYAANPQGVSGDVTALLERVGAKVLAPRPWQDGKLSYSIKGHRKGLHFLVYFSMDSRQLHELDRLAKFNESILRHMI